MFFGLFPLKQLISAAFAAHPPSLACGCAMRETKPSDRPDRARIEIKWG
jgi:hypothetical protein